MKVYQAVAEAFVREGTSTVFGLLGDGQLGWWSEMAKHTGVRIIDVRDEGAALSMAEGWTRVTGRVGVCSTTQGPGLTRLATSLVVASRGRFPLVVYCACAPLNDENHAHYLDQKQFVTSTNAGFIEILTPDYAETAVREAFYRARVESRPIVLSIPLDVQNMECATEGADYRPSFSMYKGQQRIRPDVEVLNEAAGIIAQCKKPVVLLGRGALSSKAGDAAARLAQRIGALVATTLLTKGAQAEGDYHAGISGMYASRTSIKLYEEADCVIAVGASLNRYTIEGGYLYPNARFIHIDVAQHVMMGDRTAADCYIQGDAAATLDELDTLLSTMGAANIGFRTPEVRAALQTKNRDTAEFEIPPGTVDQREVATMLDERLPSNIGVVYGAGNQKAITLLAMNKPRAPQFYAALFGCIGQSLPTAMGAAVALEGKPLVVIDGDGGTLQNIQELDTAARLGLKLFMVIMNDEAYGAEYHKLVAKGWNANLSAVRSPDFAAVARGFGCRGLTARSMAEVAQGIEEFLAGDGPLLMDVRISRHVVSIPHRRAHFGQDV